MSLWMRCSPVPSGLFPSAGSELSSANLLHPLVLTPRPPPAALHGKLAVRPGEAVAILIPSHRHGTLAVRER